MTRFSRIIISLFYLLTVMVTGLFADGFLTVRTEPEGIEVWLDDNFVGDSPIIDKKLKAGRYSLKLVDPVQHSSTIEEIFIQNSENTVIEKTIKTKFGSLKVTSVPEGAIVSIATELGSTPVSNDFMNPGKYRVEIRHPNKLYLPVIEEVTIPRGESVSLSKTLEREAAFTQKDFWRLALGAGTAGGYIWAIVQNGRYNRSNENEQVNKEYGYDVSQGNKEVQSSAMLQTVLGIVTGSLCLVGLEIIAFF
jgi:hypothetical protein